MKDRDEAIDDRVKELLKTRNWQAPTTESLGADRVMDAVLRNVYAMGWAHAEEDFASDYQMLESRLHDVGPEWDYLKKLAKKRRPADEYPASKAVVLAERAQELVEIMRTEHEDVINALRSLPAVEGGLEGRLTAIEKKNKERLARLTELLAKTKSKKAVKKSPSKR